MATTAKIPAADCGCIWTYIREGKRRIMTADKWCPTGEALREKLRLIRIKQQPGSWAEKQAHCALVDHNNAASASIYRKLDAA